MNREKFLDAFRSSIQAINNKRYFSTERGYQRQLLAELKNNLDIEKLFDGNTIVEQEYQKTLEKHGIRIRPDIIIHVPYKREMHKNRLKNNFVVIQIKCKASE